MKQRLSSICGIGSVLTGALMCASCMGSYQIEGNVDGHGYDGHVMSLVEYTQQGFQVLDSCTVSHGTFNMDGATDTVRFVMLCKDYVPVIPMYLERAGQRSDCPQLKWLHTEPARTICSIRSCRRRMR